MRRLCLLIFVWTLNVKSTFANCPCCQTKPIQQSCNPFKGYVGPAPPIPLQGQIFKPQNKLHSKPFPPFKDGLWISSAPADVNRESDIWRQNALQLLWQERASTNPTPLIHLTSPGLKNVEFILKDESFSPTSSISYRTAWKLIFWMLLHGFVERGTHIVDASFGNTAIAEAYFSNILGINYTAVVPENLDEGRLLLLSTYKARILLAKPSELLLKAEVLASSRPNMIFINQYMFAKNTVEMEESYFAPLTSTNIMGELVGQLFVKYKKWILPDYFVSSAGTGSTILSIGHFVKKYGIPTEIVLADTEFSSYFDYAVYGKFLNESVESLWVDPGLGGLGFGQFETSRVEETRHLNPNLVDRALKLPDLASIAAMHFLRSINIDAGPATGISFLAAFSIAAKEKQRRQSGQSIKIALLITDPGRFYDKTYYNQQWIDNRMGDSGGFKLVQCWLEVIKRCFQADCDPLESGPKTCPSPMQELIENL
ncbi:PALP domain-containing protein [Aphelenchoides bicaudatus]|nr:PALP domain-containing protein [Aphelenchoides bicaudatus]